ncbi:YtpR family tRNA-binding protein [Levilactobacillus zymae]|uniref:YtpR family tRNA-binding protein n=1 Tax=Levilactobacillus zymae TaxID=267363 RepID=UPI003FCE73AA
MLIASYNPRELGDTLIVIVAQDTPEQAHTVREGIARIYDPATEKTLGYNFLAATEILPELQGQGQVALSAADVAALNQALEAAGFAGELVAETSSRFVVGYVKTATPHPDSDHLLVTETVVDNDQTLQIVSGSPNMQADIKVVVAKVGAMMPNGLIIWPGELRGVPSNGMICSGRELGLANAPQRPGALILPDDYQVGDEFDFDRGHTIFAAN